MVQRFFSSFLTARSPFRGLPSLFRQSTILRWNSRSCLLARYYEGDGALAGCRNSSVQFDLVFGEFSDWPYYPDQLMTIYRQGLEATGCVHPFGSDGVCVK